MIVGIVFICVGINANHYAKSHVWGDPGSISDREHKAPYIEKYKNYCMSGGIITFVGFLVFISKGRSTILITENKKENKNNNDNIKKLEELKKLLDNGTITKEDFENKKQDLLKKI